MTAGSTGSGGANSRTLAALGLGGFVVLGLPDGMWGTAWPAMRHTFHQPLGSLGLILIFATIGNLVTSLSTGRTLRRFGVARLLVVAGLIAATGALLIAIASVWAMVLIGALLAGMAAGLLDTGLNTVIALSGRLRLLNMLHGAYGVGSAIGPLVVTAAILITSWRPAYFLLIALELLLAYGWWRTSSHWTPEVADGEAVAVVDTTADAPTRHVGLLVALGVGAFFFYTGLEVTAGQWAASFFRGPLGLSAGSAGPAVFAYWGSLTAARFGIAIPRRTPNPVLLVRLGCIGGLVASALIWWAPSTAVVIVGFALAGCGACAGLSCAGDVDARSDRACEGAARDRLADRRRQRGRRGYLRFDRHHLATRRPAHARAQSRRHCGRIDRLQHGVGVVQPALIQTAT